MSVMNSPASSCIEKYNQSSSSMANRKVNVVAPSCRKLWEKNNVEQETNRENCWMFGNLKVQKGYDTYAAPQFVDFLSLPDKGEASTFFDKGLIASTPNVKSEKSNLANKDDDTLTNSFVHLSLSAVKLEMSEQVCNNNNLQNENSAEQYVVRKATPVLDKFQPNIYTTAGKPQKTIVKPFSFDLREKKKQEHKQERINEILEQQKKAREFRAKPIPQFVKLRSTLKPSNTENNKGLNGPEKHGKRNIEQPWMKSLFKPNVSTKPLVRPKTPPLRSAIRAKERKQFDEELKQKEKLREEMRKKELAIKEQQEREEIARLRKQLVHKAQPIPAYVSGIRKVEKRPLTDPFTPLLLKRRRRY